MNTVSYFEIQATDVLAAMQFYKAIFGWCFIKQEGLPVEYYDIETSGIRGGLLQRPTTSPSSGSGTNAFVCSVQVEDFDKTGEKIEAIGGKVALPKFAVPGRCWQGYFTDTDNNTFGIFEVDENAG